MAETLIIPQTTSRQAIYDSLVPQIAALIDGEPDLVANLANIAAALKEAFGFFWIGFYLKKDDQLVLGPFQGPVACTRISFNKGVCGAAYTRRETILVPDVDQFPGHIVCDSASRSEIVIPIMKDAKVIGVVDIDSPLLSRFDEVDQAGLEKLVDILVEKTDWKSGFSF